MEVTKKKFDGSFADLESEFREETEKFIRSLFHHLRAKRSSNGDILQLKDLTNIFKNYAQIFEKSSVPKTEDLLEASSKIFYQREMDKLKTLVQEKFEAKSQALRKIVNNTSALDQFKISIKSEMQEIIQKIKFLRPDIYRPLFEEETDKFFEKEFQQQVTNNRILEKFEAEKKQRLQEQINSQNRERGLQEKLNEKKRKEEEKRAREKLDEAYRCLGHYLEKDGSGNKSKWDGKGKSWVRTTSLRLISEAYEDGLRNFTLKFPKYEGRLEEFSVGNWKLIYTSEEKKDPRRWTRTISIVKNGQKLRFKARCEVINSNTGITLKTYDWKTTSCGVYEQNIWSSDIPSSTEFIWFFTRHHITFLD